MRQKELSYPEPSTTATDIESSGKGEVTIKECCPQRFKPSYQLRRVNNRGALLALVWSYLIISAIFFFKHVASTHSSSLVNGVLLAIIGLTLPLAGSLADVRFGRYKILSSSLWIMWISAVLLTVILVVAELTSVPHKDIAIVSIVLLLGIGWAGFQANIVQFGIDQLTDASATQYKAFVAWISWSFIAGVLLLFYIVQCVEYKLVAPLLTCCNLTLALVLNLLLNRILIKEPSTQNPFKLVYTVLRYALKNKYPRQRSAFTYCEESFPSRIDFGKEKYGGPFTTEQVEDVKTLLRIIIMVAIGTAVYSVSDEGYFTKSKVTFMFRSNRTQPRAEYSYEFITTGFYFISGTILIPLYELIVHPLSHRILPNIKSHHKFAIGTLLRWIRLIVLLALVTYSRQTFINSKGHYSNTTVSLPCLFQEPPGFLSDYIDYRWTILSKIIYATSDLMIFIGSLEFLCAQVPYSMKGLAVGIVYTFLAIYISAFSAIQQIFEKPSLTWGTGVISCGFWYLVTTISLLAITIIILFIAMKFYKKRKREDVLPNEQIFAERYYSSS